MSHVKEEGKESFFCQRFSLITPILVRIRKKNIKTIWVLKVYLNLEYECMLKSSLLIN